MYCHKQKHEHFKVKEKLHEWCERDVELAPEMECKIY